MADTTVTTQYEVVRSGVANIEEIHNKMESIVNEFDTSMGNVLNPEIFKGTAANEVGTDYQVLKSQAVEFLDLVMQFSGEYRKAADIMEQHEEKLKQDTNILNQDLTRM